MNIKNKVILVTGANRGIGEAVTKELIKNGAIKIYTAVRDIKKVDHLVQEYGNKIVPIELDVTDIVQIKSIHAQTKDIDILINNAGITVFGSLLGEDKAAAILQNNLQVNLYGILNLTKELIISLKDKSEAAIVNVSSITGLGNMPVIGAYSVSKAAVHSLTQGFRGELIDTNILVSGVYPGPVETEMSKDFDAPKDSPENVAISIIKGIQEGKEDIFPDATAKEVETTYFKNPKTIEQQFSNYK